MASEEQAEPARPGWTLISVLAVAAFLAASLALLAVAEFTTGVRSGLVGERVANALGAATIPWGLGIIALFASARRRRPRLSDFGLAALAMLAIGGLGAGMRMAGRASGEAEVAATRRPGLAAYLEELKTDYPQLYARREALIDQRESMPADVWGRKVTAIRVEYEMPALATITDALAIPLERNRLDQIHEAQAVSPETCVAVVGGGARAAISAETIDVETGIMAQALRAHAVNPAPGPLAGQGDIDGLVSAAMSRLTPADKASVVAMFASARAPTNTKEAAALCTFNVMLTEETIARGPAFAGKLVRAQAAPAR